VTDGSLVTFLKQLSIVVARGKSLLNGSDEDREAPPPRACLPLSLLDPAFADPLPRPSHSHSQSAPSACVLSKTTALAMEGKANSTLAL
jgi:hypothetical protein